MRRELLAGVSTIALVIASASAATLFSDPAGAADLARKAAPAPMAAPVPAYSWTGCYVGAHVGWGWANNHWTENSSFFGSATGGINTNGGLFGGQVGCNYQWAGNWVVGVQGDFAGTDINGLAGGDLLHRFTDDSVGLKTEWLASVTGRVGWTFWNNQALFYVKGGGAWARDQWDFHNAEFAIGFNDPIVAQDRSGWTVGVGAEWTLWSPNWTAFVEYNYYQLNGGDHTFQGNCECGPTTISSGRTNLNTVKVGVNYKFNWFGGGY